MITRYPFIIVLMVLGSSQDWIRSGTIQADFIGNVLQKHIIAFPMFIDVGGDGTNINFPLDTTASIPSGIFTQAEETYFAVGKILII